MVTRLTTGPIVLLSACAVALALVSGCDAPGMSKKPNTAAAVVKPASGPTGETTTTGAAWNDKNAVPGPTVDTVGLSISSEIAQACGIAARDGKAVAPSFDFDSAALAPDDRTMLASIAKCLSDGPLRGRSIALVGRTDPRGEPEYNMGLGGSRAATVDRYMIDLGVGRDRLSTTSRGAMDAKGKDEPGWALDRRVDIELVKTTAKQ